jgi:hypothetical protein
MSNLSEMPRHRRAFDKEGLLKLLSTPMRVNRLTGLAQETAKKRGFDDRIEAMFAYFDIPDDWPELLQWRQLALCLAGKHFFGCRTISRGIGGPSKSTRERKKQSAHALLIQFKAYQSEHPQLRDNAAATNFLKKFRVDCSKAGFSKWKSFLQAMRKLEKENGI